MSEHSITSKRGPLVIMGIAIFVAIIILGSILISNHNFDNDRIKGTYTGTISLIDHPIYQSNFTFDGEGNFDGIVEIEGNFYDVDGGYQCVGEDFVMSFMLNGSYIYFEGYLASQNSIITGLAQLYDSADSAINGTFSLAIL